MTDYPDAMIERVGQAIRAELRPERKDEGPLYLDHDVHEYQNLAIAALDALGLTIQRQRPRFYKDSSSTRFVTRWVSDD